MLYTTSSFCARTFGTHVVLGALPAPVFNLRGVEWISSFLKQGFFRCHYHSSSPGLGVFFSAPCTYHTGRIIECPGPSVQFDSLLNARPVRGGRRPYFTDDSGTRADDDSRIPFNTMSNAVRGLGARPFNVPVTFGVDAPVVAPSYYTWGWHLYSQSTGVTAYYECVYKPLQFFVRS